MTFNVVVYDVADPTISWVHYVVGLTDIIGPDLQYRMLSSYVMSSVLTYNVVNFLHYVACDIAYDVSFESNFGVLIACSLNDQRLICSFCSFLFTDRARRPLPLQQPNSIATPAHPQSSPGLWTLFHH